MLSHMLLALLLAQSMPAGVLKGQNPMELSQEMVQFLDRKVDRGLPPLERLQALVTAVFQDPELNFTYAPVNRTAMETFATRQGNCLSFTLLFISMARHLNLDARFREVTVPPMFTKSGAFVNLSQHLNAAVLIGSQAYAIDVFPGVSPIGIGGQVVSDERGLAHFYNNLGVDELSNGNYELARKYLKKALETDPTAVCALINLGAERGQNGRFAEAERYYRQALALEPQNLAAMSNLAGVFEQTGRTRDAARLQAKVKEFREKNPYHHFYLGQQAYDEGKYEEALAHYKKAIKLKGTDHNFYFAAARTHAQIGQSDEVVNNLLLAEKYASDPANKLRYAEKLELLKKIRLQDSHAR